MADDLIGHFEASAAPGDLVDLYHHTYPESAESIYRDRHFEPGTDEDRVYFTNLPSGGSGESDYGSGVVHLRMPRRLVNDWGPDAHGEHYYDADPDDIRPEHFVDPARQPHEAAVRPGQDENGEWFYGEQPAHTADLPEEMHRGVGLWLPQEVHDVVHDASRPLHERAQALLGHMDAWSAGQARYGEGGLGIHWSVKPSSARGFATRYDTRNHKPMDFVRDARTTQVVFHARTAQPSQMLRSKRKLDEHEIFGINHGEGEIPLKKRSRVHLTGISWAPNGDKDAEMTRYDFPEPIRRTAGIHSAPEPGEELLFHFEAAHRPGRGEKTCACCHGEGSHPDGSECGPCDGSGMMHSNDPDVICPGQPQPRRRHWREASAPGEDYGYQHRPLPSADPIHEGAGLASSRDLDWHFTHGEDESRAEATRQFRRSQGKPDHPVRIYRAAPRKSGGMINTGDWVTTAHGYARDLAEDRNYHDPESFFTDPKTPPERFHVYEATVPARHVLGGGNDLMEFGYFGDPIQGDHSARCGQDEGHTAGLEVPASTPDEPSNDQKDPLERTAAMEVPQSEDIFATPRGASPVAEHAERIIDADSETRRPLERRAHPLMRVPDHVVAENGPYHVARDPAREKGDDHSTRERNAVYNVLDREGRSVHAFGYGHDGSRSMSSGWHGAMDDWHRLTHRQEPEDLRYGKNGQGRFPQQVDGVAMSQRYREHREANPPQFPHSRVDPYDAELARRPEPRVAAPSGEFSPSDEYHGSYEVVRHPETGKFHVVDNAGRKAGTYRPFDSQIDAERSRDYTERQGRVHEIGKGFAESLFNKVEDIRDPGGTTESRQSDSNIAAANDLMTRYDGGSGKIKFDSDEDGGEPYYELEHHHPNGQPSGWYAKHYGGPQVEIHHRATGDEQAHDSIGLPSDNIKGELLPGYGHQDLARDLKSWHDEPGGTRHQFETEDPRYLPGARKIQQWKRRHQAAAEDRGSNPVDDAMRTISEMATAKGHRPVWTPDDRDDRPSYLSPNIYLSCQDCDPSIHSRVKRLALPQDPAEFRNAMIDDPNIPAWVTRKCRRTKEKARAQRAQLDAMAEERRRGAREGSRRQREGDERPYGDYTMRYRTEDLGERKPRHVIETIHPDGSTAGRLTWYGTTGKVFRVETAGPGDDGSHKGFGNGQEHRRKGIATAMWDWSQEMTPRARHSGDQTDQGTLWVKALGKPRREPPTLSATAATEPDPGVTVEHRQGNSGGSQYPHLHTLTATHPDGTTAELRYMTSKRDGRGAVDSAYVPKGYAQSLGVPLIRAARRIHPGAFVKGLPGLDEDWGEHLPSVSSIHRHLTVKLEPADRDYVHDESVPKAHRAAFLMDLMGKKPSMHWASQRGRASAEERFGDHEFRSPEHTQIAINADPPSAEHVETDPERISRNGGYAYQAPDWEVPLKEGAPVSVNSVRWRTGGSGWTRHQFRDGHPFTAGRREDPVAEVVAHFAVEAVAHVAAATLGNPHTGRDEWFHGTQAHPEDLAHGFSDPMGDDENAWNARLGTHFTSDHELGRQFAKGEHNIRRDDEGWALLDDDEEPNPSVVHARLHLSNPKVYASEHDMDHEAYEHEHAAGNHPSRDFPDDPEDREWDERERPGTYEIHREWGDRHIPAEATSPFGTRNAGHPVRQLWLTSHPDAQGIASRFKERLQAQGHDGIVYGNAWEHGPAGMSAPSAIAFHPGQIEITRHHGDQEPCQPETPGRTAAAVPDVIAHFAAAGPWMQQKLFHAQPDPTQHEPESKRHNPDDPDQHLHWRSQNDEDYEPDSCLECGVDQRLNEKHIDEDHEDGLHSRRSPEDPRVPLYHGSNRPFQVGDQIEVGHPGNFTDEPLEHVYMTEQAEGSDAYKGARGYGRHVYEVTPTGPYGRRSDARGMEWASQDPLRVEREVPDPRISRQAAAEVVAHFAVEAAAEEYGPKPEFVAAPEHLSDDEKMAHWEGQRRIKDDWEGSTRHGLSMGHLNYDQARKLGYWGNGDELPDEGWDHDGNLKWRRGWQALPQHLYHVTTNLPAVRESGGLKTRRELEQHRSGGLGLGGGPDDTISLTGDHGTARNILRAMHEYHDVLNGRRSPHDMVDEARTGRGAQRPFLHEWNVFSGHATGSGEDELARPMRDVLEGRESYTYPTLRTKQDMHEQEGPGWEPEDEGRDFGGRHVHNGPWHRTPTPERRRQQLSEFYKNFAWARQHAGGHDNPLFVSNDVERFAHLDPGHFAIVHATPRPGAQGFPESSLGEWRTASGDAVQVHRAERLEGGHLKEAALTSGSEFDPDDPSSYRDPSVLTEGDRSRLNGMQDDEANALDPQSDEHEHVWGFRQDRPHEEMRRSQGSATQNRDHHDRECAALGHDMSWEHGEGWGKPGYAQEWNGTCRHCGAGMSAGSASSTSHGLGRMARDEPCAGPGTAWQNDLIAERRHNGMQDAVSQFGQEVKDNLDRQWLKDQGLGTEAAMTSGDPSDGQPPKGARFFHGRTGTYPAAAGDILSPQPGGMRHMYYTTHLPTAARAAAYGHPLNARGYQDLDAEALPGRVYEVVPETAAGRRIGRHAVDPDSGLPGAVESWRTKGRLRVLHEVDRETGEPLAVGDETPQMEREAAMIDPGEDEDGYQEEPQHTLHPEAQCPSCGEPAFGEKGAKAVQFTLGDPEGTPEPVPSSIAQCNNCGEMYPAHQSGEQARADRELAEMNHANHISDRQGGDELFRHFTEHPTEPVIGWGGARELAEKWRREEQQFGGPGSVPLPQGHPMARQIREHRFNRVLHDPAASRPIELHNPNEDITRLSSTAAVPSDGEEMWGHLQEFHGVNGARTPGSGFMSDLHDRFHSGQVADPRRVPHQHDGPPGGQPARDPISRMFTPIPAEELEAQRRAREPKPERLDDREHSIRDVSRHYDWEGFDPHEISHLVHHPEQATFTREDVPVHTLRHVDEHGNLAPIPSYRDIAGQGDDERERLEGLERGYDNGEPVPPIVAVRDGEHHIIADGSHRAAVHAERGSTHIPAFVTQRTIYPDQHREAALAAHDDSLDWNEIADRHPALYGDPETHGDEASEDGNGIADAAAELYHDRPEKPYEETYGSLHPVYGGGDMRFYPRTVDPSRIDYARSEPGDPRVNRARRGYESQTPEQVPPVILVHRHGVFQVADGHHRSEGAVKARKPVRAYVAYSPHEDEPFSEGDRGPFHGAEAEERPAMRDQNGVPHRISYPGFPHTAEVPRPMTHEAALETGHCGGDNPHPPHDGWCRGTTFDEYNASEPGFCGNVQAHQYHGDCPGLEEDLPPRDDHGEDEYSVDYSDRQGHGHDPVFGSAGRNHWDMTEDGMRLHLRNEHRIADPGEDPASAHWDEHSGDTQLHVHPDLEQEFVRAANPSIPQGDAFIYTPGEGPIDPVFGSRQAGELVGHFDDRPAQIVYADVHDQVPALPAAPAGFWPGLQVPEGREGLLEALREMPALVGVLREELWKLAVRLSDESPLHPSVIDMIFEMAASCRTAQEDMGRLQISSPEGSWEEPGYGPKA